MEENISTLYFLKVRYVLWNVVDPLSEGLVEILFLQVQSSDKSIPQVSVMSITSYTNTTCKDSSSTLNIEIMLKTHPKKHHSIQCWNQVPQMKSPATAKQSLIYMQTHVYLL